MFLKYLYQRLASYRFKKIHPIIRLLKKSFGEQDPGEINFNFSTEPTRMQIIQKIIDKKKYNSYLEIGTNTNELFLEIVCEKKIGVDPYSGGNKRMTSDSFFKQNEEKFDCIFIDGLHHYDQVKKDIINSINCLNDNGAILIHDCLPKNISAQSIPRTELVWNGDVWKALVEQRTKGNLDCYTILADHGIGLILKRKNRDILKIDTNNFKKLKFSYFYENHKKIMNIFKFEQILRII